MSCGYEAPVVLNWGDAPWREREVNGPDEGRKDGTTGLMDRVTMTVRYTKGRCLSLYKLKVFQGVPGVEEQAIATRPHIYTFMLTRTTCKHICEHTQAVQLVGWFRIMCYGIDVYNYIITAMVKSTCN